MNLWKLAFRVLVRDKNFTVFFLLNLVLGLLGFTTLEIFRTAFHATLTEQSQAILTADLSIASRRDLTPQESQTAKEIIKPMRETQTLQVFSMVAANSLSRLVNIRGINPGFPFYGDLRLQDLGHVRGGPPESFFSKPIVWASHDILNQLDVKKGDSIRIGKIDFVIGDVIEKDLLSFQAGGSIAPRIYVSESQLRRTGLIAPGSSQWITRLYVVAPNFDVKDISRKLDSALKDPALSIETHYEASENIGRLVKSIRDFLSLIAVGAMILTAFGLGVLFQDHLLRHVKTLALLQTFGLTPVQSHRWMILQVTILVSLGSFIVITLSVATFPLIQKLLAYFLPIDIHIRLSGIQILETLGIAGAQTAGVCWPFLRAWKNLSPHLLFNEQHQVNLGIRKIPVMSFVPLCLVYCGLSLIQTRSIRDGLIYFLAFLGMISLAAVTLRWCLTQLRSFKIRSVITRLSVRNLSRTPRLTMATFLSLMLAVVIMTLIPHIQKSLQEDLRPPDRQTTPSFFLFDIQPEQLASVRTYLTRHHLQLINESPLIRARLAEVNGLPFTKSDEETLTREQEQEKRFRNREFNLTYRDGLFDSEQIISGRPVVGPTNENEPVEISLEERFAKRLKLKIGDILVFDVQGVSVSTRVTNLRSVQWTSFQPNFFVQFPKGVLEDAPQTFLAGIPPLPSQEKNSFLSRFVSEFPTISVIDVSSLVDRLIEVIRNMTTALQFMAVVSGCAAAGVMLSIVQHQLQERTRDAQLLVTLGATQSEVRRILVNEAFLISGASSCAGCILGLGIHAILGKMIFDIPWAVSMGPMIAVSLLVITAACVAPFLLLRWKNY